MLFNRRSVAHFSLLSVFVFSLVGCSFFFSEKKKEEEVSYNQEVGSCIGQVNSMMVSYFSTDGGDVTNDQIDEFSTCYIDSLESFITHTKSGRLESNDYSAENIESLIERFHPGQTLSAYRLRGYIRLKSFLIGGAEETISKEELLILQKLVPQVSKALKVLLPYRKIILRNQKMSRTEVEYVKYHRAMEELRKQVKGLVKTLDRHEGRRRINIEEVSQFFFSEFFGEEAGRYFKYLSLIISFKNFALHEEGIQLKRSNFSSFVTQGISTYDALTRFNYFLLDESDKGIFKNIGHIASFIARVPSQLENAKMFQGVGLRALDDILNIGNKIVQRAIVQRPDKRVKLIKLSDILYSLEEAGKITPPLTAKTLSLYMRNFTRKWIEPGVKSGSHLTLGKLRYIEEMVNIWFERQQITNTLFNKAGSDTISLTKYRRALPKNKRFKQWYQALKQVATHQWDDKKRLRISSELGSFTYEEFTVSNSISLLVELFMKPYNLDESDFLKYKITESQTQEIYELNRVLGVELAFMDSRIDDSGNRAFLEMNSFSTQRSSDEFMNFYEGYEYLSFAFNAGELSSHIYENIPESCQQSAIDVLGENVLKKQCFSRHLKKNFEDYFSHLPTVYEYWKDSSESQKNEFLDLLEISSRGGTIRGKAYDLAEIRVVVSILSFVESIFFMFDTKNINGKVEGVEYPNAHFEAASVAESELRRAERHFRPLITHFVKKYKPGLTKEHETRFQRNCGNGNLDHDQLLECIAPKLFIHLLINGSLPVGENATVGQLKFLGILNKKAENAKFQETSVDAGQVLGVFSAIADITGDGRVELVRNFLLERQPELLDSMQGEQAPDCQQRPKHVFCLWSRALYCTDKVTQNVFDEFRYNRSNWFDEDLYEMDKEKAVDQTMIDIHSIFAKHDIYSTNCAFPTLKDQVEEESKEAKGIWKLFGD